ASIPSSARDKQLLYLRRIGGMGEYAKSAMPQLAVYLRSFDSEIRKTAYQVLVAINSVNEFDKPLFLSCLNCDWSIEAKTFGAWAFTRTLIPASAIAQLGNRLTLKDRPHAEMRVMILKAIAYNQTNTLRELVSAVITCLDDDIKEVRDEASQTLDSLDQKKPL